MPSDYSYLLEGEYSDRLDFSIRCRRNVKERIFPNEPALPMVAIFDLDMTLSDHTHRFHHLNLEDLHSSDWDAYWAGAGKDAPLQDTIMLARFLYACHVKIVIMTGRAVTTLGDTLLWFSRHGVPYDELYMRPEDDYTPSATLKYIWYNTMFKDEKVFAVFEDRDSDVDMWRGQGLQCYQPRRSAS